MTATKLPPPSTAAATIQHGDSWESIARQIGVPKDTLHQYRTRVRRRTEQELAA